MKKGFVIRFAAIALLTATILILAQVYLHGSNAKEPLDPDRVVSLTKIVSDVVQEYYWIHEKLPASYSDIKQSIERFPKEWGPLPGYKITWHSADASHLNVQVTGPAGDSMSEDYDVDLRSIEDSWSLRFTYLDLKRFGKAMDHPKNLADAVAMSVYRVHASSGNRSPSWKELFTQEDGYFLTELNAQARTTYSIKANTIHVRVNGSPPKTYTYPLTGP